MLHENLAHLAYKALAETAFVITAREFPEDTGDNHPVFRLSNLFQPEIESFLQIWTDRVSGTRLEKAQVVISHDGDGKYPSEFIARPDCSITYYRNNIEHGLLYIETSPVSDEQGLRNIFTLRDVNFLDGQFDSEDDGFFVAEEIVHSAWRQVSDRDNHAPGLVVDLITQVLRSLREHKRSVPVRPFVRFCARIALERCDPGKSFDVNETKAVIGRALVELNMFPDDIWATNPTEAKISRRLFLNWQHADLVGANGLDLDGDALASQAKDVVFKNAGGSELPAEEQNAWREKCSNYCISQSPDIRLTLPYSIFEQLFVKDTTGMKLGERTENELTDNHGDRLPEWDELAVKAGLDKKDQFDAQKFLDAEPDDPEKPALRDLITAATRRMIEKAASPATQSISNPLIKIAEFITSFPKRSTWEFGDDRPKLRISVGKMSPSAESTLGLLAFIYGPTLQSLSEASKLGTEGFELEVDNRLFKQAPPPPLRTDPEDGEREGDELQEEAWEPVPLVFEVLAPNSREAGKFDLVEKEIGFQWFAPEIEMLALFWLLSTADDAPDVYSRLDAPSDQSFTEWRATLVGRTVGLGTAQANGYPAAAATDPIVVELKDVQQNFRTRSKKEGLSQELLFEVFDKWLAVSERFRTELIPAGTTDVRTEIFLSSDTISTNGGRGLLMLPSHPLRLRWIAKYLERSEQLASRALSGQLKLNVENGELYLDWISNLTPHQQPALAIGKNQETLFATSEQGWAEFFAPLEWNAGREVGIDAHSTAEIARQISKYLAVHPHKSEGLSLLIVLPKGAALPAKLLTLFRKGEWEDLPVDVNVVAPVSNWPTIIKEFEKLPVEDRMSNKDTLLPPLQLRFHNLADLEELPSVLGKLDCDIGIIPQFVTDDPQMQDETATSLVSAGSFDILLDPPTVFGGGSKGEAITVSKLPAASDQALETWSTIVVRHRRTSPVAKEMPANTDQVKLLIDFRKEAELFELLHKLNHWVITIERHISREQIENLETSPEILTVKENVGASGLYTLIVSSNSGMEYSIQRIERKLSHVLGVEALSNRQLAEQIYDEARSLAPSLALQAMGISRITEEMLGLVIAKQVAASRFPVSDENSASIWISLDDHTEWFGGVQGTRADLCRLSLSVSSSSLFVDVLVVEGKFRQAYDAHGEAQVRRTLRLFQDILVNCDQDLSEEEPQGNVDCDLWRSKLLDAADSAGSYAKEFSGEMRLQAKGTSLILPTDIRQRIKSGKYTLRSLKGLFSICNYLKEGASEVEEFREENYSFEVVKTFQNTICELVEGSVGQISPRGTAAPKPPEPCPPVEPVTLPDPSPLASVSPAAPKPEQKKRLPPEELGARYQSIIDKLAEFGVSVKPTSDPNMRLTEGPATIMYRVIPGAGVTPSSISQKADSLKLALKLKEEQEIRFSVDEGYVTIDVPKSDDDRYFVNAEELWLDWVRQERALACPIGIDRTGNPVEVNFSSSNSPHLLIGGTTGSGKSEALNTILFGLVHKYSANELKLLLIDPKGTELEAFENADHVEGMIGMDDEDACELLERAVEEMQSRYKLLKSERTRSIAEFNSKVSAEKRIPWWLIVLDEYADLTSDPESKKKIEANLKRLAQKARAAGIHVIIATQKPSAEVISTNLRSNLPAQLALRVKSGIESRVVMDELGAETLNGKGDAFLKSEGRLIRVQCAIVSS